MAARHKEGYYLRKKYPCIFLCAKKGLTIDNVGVSVDTVFQVIRPGAGFETGDFVEKRLGGLATVRTTRWLVRSE